MLGLASVLLLPQARFDNNPLNVRDPGSGTVKTLRELLEKESTQEVTEELNKTLAAARYQLEGESTGSYQLVTTLKEVETAARSLREFLHLLEVKPEALIRGKSDTGGQ